MMMSLPRALRHAFGVKECRPVGRERDICDLCGDDSGTVSDRRPDGKIGKLCRTCKNFAVHLREHEDEWI